MKKILILLPLFLFASLNVYVNKQKVYPGEEVIYTIEANGNKIEFPQINKIGEFEIKEVSEQENIIIINGEMKKTIAKSYIFFPTKNITIPSFKVKIDNKIYYTKPIKIEIKKYKQSNNSDYKINISINKNKAFLTEPLIFTITFFQKENKTPNSIEIQQPNLDNFFTKEISKKTYKKNNYKVTEYKFLLIPQKAGKYQIGPLLAKIGFITKTNIDPFFSNFFVSSLNYINIFSNKINLDILPIPNNSIYGDFKAKLIANKTTTKADEPVKITLEINGCGDFYDLPDFKLNINNVTIYENTPSINTYIKNEQLCGSYKKEFTIISNKDIIIPPITFKAFNKKLYTIKTNQIYIKIKNKPKPIIINSKEENKTTTKFSKTSNNNYFLIIGIFIIIGFITLLIALLIKNRKKDDLITKIKKANQKELFYLLLPYSNNKQIEKILKDLEKNIYKNQNNPINKKEIIKIIKNLAKNS